MSVWTAAVRRGGHVTRLCTWRFMEATNTSQPANLIHRRGLAAGGDHHGPTKVNFWEDPLRPSKWKEGHFATISVAGCVLLIYGGWKFFIFDDKEGKLGGKS